MSIFLEYNQNKKIANENIVQNTLAIINKFYKWSGLKVNRGKTQLTIFGKRLAKPRLVETLNIKWCTSFRLLGIQFNNTLSDMDSNYDKGIKEMREISNSWKFRYLTIFGKITVIKTFMLPKLTHTVTVVPSLTAKLIEEIE